MMVTPISSMTAGQFWNMLKTEADAVSWNLRDVIRNGSVGETKPSLDRAVQSSERIVTMISDRMEEFKRQMSERRNGSGRR